MNTRNKQISCGLELTLSLFLALIGTAIPVFCNQPRGTHPVKNTH
jgi:hypothetical protein